jgi:hypothetical protein
MIRRKRYESCSVSIACTLDLGDGVPLTVGGLRDGCTTSDNLAPPPRDGGDTDRLSILSCAGGEGAVDVGDESVAIGGKAIGLPPPPPTLLLLLCDDNPAPIGRGCGGSTTANGGLGA